MFRRIPRVRVGAIAYAATLARLPRRAATLVLAGVLPLSAALLAGSTAPANAAVAVAPVRMENVYTNLCLDGSGLFLFGAGAQVILNSCGNDYQQWEIIPRSGYYQIVLAAATGACLDGVEGTYGVTLKGCIAGDLHQHWIAIRVNGAVINSYEDQANGECLDGTFVYGVRVMPCSPANIPDTHQWFGG
jgi:hypothetical protein